MWARELTLIDVGDALPHLPVHARELEHTLTLDIEGDGYLLFKALLFGFKTAPLLWSRVAAWSSRIAFHNTKPNTRRISMTHYGRCKELYSEGT